MTKKDIIIEVSYKTGITREAVSAVIDETINVVKKTLCNNEAIYIRGLFTLSHIKRAQKYTRNIRKGETIISPAHYVPHAKFAKEIRNKIKESSIK